MALMNRRNFLKWGGTAALLTTATGCTSGTRNGGHVVVVGGGFGGATVAKYLRMWSEGNVQVTLVERNASFVSCPISNLVIAGSKSMADITVPYDILRTRWGIRVIQDEALGVDPDKRTVRLAHGGNLTYDRLVLSPGVDFMFDQIPSLNDNGAQSQILHAWKAGPQTMALRAQLEAMRDGGTYVISVPKAPYRCPPGPYERASVVADYFKRHKPRAKVIVLDANDDITSKKGLFIKAWQDLYKGTLEYHPGNEVRDVDPKSSTAILEFDKVKADVLNIIPPQRAGQIATQAGLKLANNRWVDIDWLTMESVSTPGVHVIGDAILLAPTMPKSGHMANQHGKLAAAAIVNLLAGEAPDPAPVVMNTCYSFVDQQSAMHVSSVHQYDPATRTVQPVKGAGGLSVERSALEGMLALGWSKNIWADMLA